MPSVIVLAETKASPPLRSLLEVSKPPPNPPKTARETTRKLRGRRHRRHPAERTGVLPCGRVVSRARLIAGSKGGSTAIWPPHLQRGCDCRRPVINVSPVSAVRVGSVVELNGPRGDAQAVLGGGSALLRGQRVPRMRAPPACVAFGQGPGRESLRVDEMAIVTVIASSSVCRCGSSVSSIRMTANTIEASPRGPNQPRNATVGRRAPVPSGASATGSIRTTVRLRTSYEDLRHEVSAYLIVHVGTLIFIGLMGVALYMLVRDLPGKAAAISRLAIGPFVLFYAAWETVIGLAIGVLVQHANHVPAGERAAVSDAIQAVGANAIIGDAGVLLTVGALTWITAVIAAAVASVGAAHRCLQRPARAVGGRGVAPATDRTDRPACFAGAAGLLAISQRTSPVTAPTPSSTPTVGVSV